MRLQFTTMKWDSLTDDQVLLDVRNPGELEEVGYFEGAINIPVDQLRHRMDELPKDKRDCHLLSSWSAW